MMETIKAKIKIADTQFAHGTSLGSGDLKIYPKFFEWYRGDENMNDIIVITESMFHKVDTFTEKIKIAWLIEPVSINSESYRWIEQHLYKFKFILSHNLEFIEDLKKIKLKTCAQNYDLIPENNPLILWYPFGGCWIMPEDRKIYPKTKAVSIIASAKRETEGHKLRHEIIAALGDKIDVYGHGYKSVENKLEALKDYQYSIVIENEKTPGFFTEKVIDCFMTGTIPIYWGDNVNMEKADGIKNPQRLQIISFSHDNINELKKNIDEIYNNEPHDHIMDGSLQFYNFHAAARYTCPEDWLWLNFFTKYFNSSVTYK